MHFAKKGAFAILHCSILLLLCVVFMFCHFFLRVKYTMYCLCVLIIVKKSLKIKLVGVGCKKAKRNFDVSRQSSS